MKVTRKNPGNVAPPIGAYTHLSIVPRGADLLVLSGQVGTDAEGNLPPDVELQFRNALNNVLRILNSEGDDACFPLLWLLLLSPFLRMQSVMACSTYAL